VRHLLGVPIDALTMRQVLNVLEQVIAGKQRMLIGVVNAAKLVNMCRDPELSRAVRSADLILADGMAVVWACRLLRRHLPERVAGIDLMEQLLERGAQHRYRVFCLGATPEVLLAAMDRMHARYPGLQLAGGHHGYFSAADEPAIAEQIRRAKPDLLFVGMTSPRKEQFLQRWSRHMQVPICHGVGGAFDVMSGKTRRAPGLWQRCGLEWLYRVLQEPRRLWRRYLVTNTLFCWLVLTDALRSRVGARC
jgi:N-acetylglucosaminyldiphosphoundecaprenol N-acetyl-beta-D-mannosaminyltransferase